MGGPAKGSGKSFHRLYQSDSIGDEK